MQKRLKIKYLFVFQKKSHTFTQILILPQYHFKEQKMFSIIISTYNQVVIPL